MNSPALDNYITKEADYSISTAVATTSHLKQADFPANFFWYGSFSTLIPYPSETLNLAASFNPLLNEVGTY